MKNLLSYGDESAAEVRRLNKFQNEHNLRYPGASIAIWPTLAAAVLIICCVLFAFSSSHGQGWAKADTVQTSKSVRCEATTKAGYQCSRYTKSATHLCFQHERMQAVKKERGQK